MEFFARRDLQWWQKVTLLALTLNLTLIGARSKTRTDLIVNTDSGRVRGIRYYIPHMGKAVDAFLGIPFAKPPLGHLRFKHPVPREKWRGIYNATKLPNACYHEPDEVFGDFPGSTMWNSPTPVSEDCLYLNIYVPKTHPRIRKSAVMVWIYGGGFYSGSTTLNIYDAKYLAAEANIIVVSIAYRVGALGFLAVGHPSGPGNAGMFDQYMGLDWIQRNIRHFGGDRSNVTLFGESAGSVSVSLHLLSPLTMSKFARAIMQSGSPNMAWATLTMKEAKERSLKLAEFLDCPISDDMDVVMKCMRDVPPQTLVSQQWVSQGIAQFPFVPVIDGAFLVESPLLTLKRRNFKKCPILTGSNLNEGSFFLIYELNKFIKLDKSTMNREQFLLSMRKLFHFYPKYPYELNSFGMEAIIHQYTNWLHQEDTYLNLKALDNAVGDYHFTCNVNKFAEYYSRAGENVYYYYLTQRYSSNPWPDWMGVLHGDDINYVFGDALKPGANYTKLEQQLSKKIIAYWSNFAKTGDPNRYPGMHSLDEWPLHTPEGKEYLELHTKFLHEANKGKAVGHGPRTKECAFWHDYLPQLISGTSQISKPEMPTPIHVCASASATHCTGTILYLVALWVIPQISR